MSEEGPSLFVMGQMFTSQRSEPLTELALGGTMGRKAMDYVSTKAEILSCQEVGSSHQAQPAPAAPRRAHLQPVLFVIRDRSSTAFMNDRYSNKPVLPNSNTGSVFRTLFFSASSHSPFLVLSLVGGRTQTSS